MGGVPVLIKGHSAVFSHWPMRRGRRDALQSHLFSSNPWSVIAQSIQRRCGGSTKAAALAFLEQAQDYYRAATLAGVSAAKPVLQYYCFMNLAKAYVLATGQQTALSLNVRHGLSEQYPPHSVTIDNAHIRAYPTTSRKINLFHELLKAVTGSGLSAETDYRVVDLLPQVVVGHRLWASALAKSERFISLKDVRFYHHPSSQAEWLRIEVFADDLSRLYVGHQRFLRETGLEGDWVQVEDAKEADGRRVLCFEQTSTVSYSGRPADKIMDLVESLKPRLWAAVRSETPYRRYYVHLKPPAAPPMLPQPLSIYAVIYYLGSVTRYHPHLFDSLAGGRYGAFIESFITDQPLQFIYLLTSEFAEQEVTKAAIV